MRAFTRRYGASPLHLLGHLAAFAVTWWALSELLLSRYAGWVNWVAWFVGGALLHDLVFLPLYAGLDRLAAAGRRGTPPRRVPVTNFVRVPAVMSGTMLLVFFPLVLGRGDRFFRADSGHDPPDFLARWLTVTAVLFTASALAYALRLRRGRTPVHEARAVRPRDR